MTASSSYSGTVDNFWSRDDIRVHTFGGSPKAVKSSLGICRGHADPHRRREASRSGSGAAARLCGRSPVGVGRLSRLGAMARIRTPKRARHGTPLRHESPVLGPPVAYIGEHLLLRRGVAASFVAGWRCT